MSTEQPPTPLQQLETVILGMPEEPDDGDDPRLQLLFEWCDEARILGITPEEVRENRKAAKLKEKAEAVEPINMSAMLDTPSKD